MVIWSQPAKNSLKNIFDFIARDSRFYAFKVISEIVKKTDMLKQFPEIGRIMPEFNSPSIREIIAFSYRIIYETRDDSVIILNIIHGKRDVTPEMVLDTE